ncbi:Inhibitor of apoptosis 2 iap-2 [Spodoptera exigua multiple nucleopolyhedrovirus]|nr:Inhibitor of apoptosis 2 iap-2 [Spodoptera exigua multiple nucleopolyhedrovirus]CDG72565.1 Inhibitor of apoptosis 2 iap-2 [Spodoptera exigua multiple nucleopolyhedrovirus]CDG72702.1 Inhibitor of apoptosis 2 iap-2 [Spodoptera exigua multiple nucleopolyhedrovirus]
MASSSKRGANSTRALDTLPTNKYERSNNCFAFLKMPTTPPMLAVRNWKTCDLAPPGFYQDPRDRLETFENSCLTREYIDDLVAGGIYRDALCNYKCAYCSLYIKKLDARRLKYHTFSTCPMATERLFVNEALRKQSFLKFKTSRTHYRDNRETLAKNGFYYYGKKFEIRCSSCKFVIVKLKADEDVWIIHAHYSPNCHFNAPSAPNWEDIDDDDDDIDINNNVITRKNNQYANIYPNLNDDKLNNNDDDDISIFSNDKITNSAASNIDDIMCKICFERERDTCFLPCRHVSTCAECAKRCKVCCICREKIKNKLEIYLQ